MNLINLTTSKKEQSLSIVFLLMLFSFIFLFIRISLTKTFQYLFLVWNVFLAVVPYFITFYLSDKKKISKLGFAFAFCVWLAFLPNAPYIITDLFHLTRSQFQNIWIDTLVISTFALTGMLLFYFSLLEMKNILSFYFSKSVSKVIVVSTLFLSAFGVYIGRFLRYNSWEILSNPKTLFNDILNMFLLPLVHKDVWLFTFSFGLFLCLGYYVFKRLNTSY